MNKRTKALQISQLTKQKVWERQKGVSVYSGKPIDKKYCCCHFIPRSKGGLGIEQNIIGLTPYEHMVFDNNLIGSHKQEAEEIRRIARKHLKDSYPNWNEEDLVWRK